MPHCPTAKPQASFVGQFGEGVLPLLVAESAGPVRCCPQLSATEQQPDHSSEPVGLATQSDISEETECDNPVLVYGVVFSNECHVSLIHS